MRHYIAVQVNIDQWHRRHDKHYVHDFTKVAADANASIRKFLFIYELVISLGISDKYLSPEDVLPLDVVSDVVKILIERVAVYSTDQINRIPYYSCPLPCEHFYSVWRNLFIVSVVLNIALALVVIPFAKRMARREPDESLMN